MQKGIKKLQNILEGFPEPHFTSEEHTLLYTYVLGFSFPHTILEAFSLFSFNLGLIDFKIAMQDRLQYVYSKAAS